MTMTMEQAPNQLVEVTPQITFQKSQLIKKVRHLKQIEIHKDKTRNKFLLAGRRGGKTSFIKEDILNRVAKSREGTEFFYFGPTNAHALELMWEPLQNRMYEMQWKFRPLISKRRFELQGGRKIFIFGAEKIERVLGHQVGHAWLDEVAFYKRDIFDIYRKIRPSLTESGGGMTLATTPNGKNTKAYDFYLSILPLENWKYFHWTTLENPFIDPQEVEQARKDLDERAFKQEYLAGWESFEGLAYYNFNEKEHLIPCREINKQFPVEIAMDFNVNPTTLLVCQNEQKLKVKKEYSLKNSSTEKTVEAFCVDHMDCKSYPIMIYGDAAGQSRHSGTGFADYHYVKQVLERYGFQHKTNLLAKNPPIIDRVMHLNSWLKNCYGTSRIEIDPACKDLIRDLSSQETDGRYPVETDIIGHKNAALGYRVYFQDLMGKRGAQRTIQL